MVDGNRQKLFQETEKSWTNKELEIIFASNGILGITIISRLV